MKRSVAVIVVMAVALALSGCGKPPKDVARKMVLSYFPNEYLTLDDIKYLSAYSKEGGYVVNIQAGDALCEMSMIKGDKEWMAKGISCNGRFLSPEKVAEHKKAQIIEALKKTAADANAKGPQTVPNGVRIEKYVFDGSRYSFLMTSPVKAADASPEAAKAIAAKFVSDKCNDPKAREVMDLGIKFGLDVNSSDGKSLISVTVADKDCTDSLPTGNNPQVDFAGDDKAGTSGIQEITANSWKSDVLQSRGLVMVDFYAIWDENSRQLRPTIEALSTEYAGRVKIGKINTDENPSVAAKYNIRAVPTVMFFKNGKKIDQIVGAAKKEIFLQKIHSLL